MNEGEFSKKNLISGQRTSFCVRYFQRVQGLLRRQRLALHRLFYERE